MCKTCKGLGVQYIINRKKIIPDNNKSIQDGGIIPLGTNKSSWSYRQIETISKNLSERDIRFIYNKSIFEIYLDNPTNYYFKNTITALVTFLRICKIYNEKPLFLNNNKYTFSL